MLTEALFIVSATLLVVTVAAAFEYYRHVDRVRKAYEKAKGAIEEIVVSFNRQLDREADKLELVAYKVEANYSKSDKALKKAIRAEEYAQSLREEIQEMSSSREEILAKLKDLDKIQMRVKDLTASYGTLDKKISQVKNQSTHLPKMPELKVNAVIPIRREKAMAPLTDTELSVLNILALEGEKTAPEIKGRIGLSREHTSRLMKKLYEEGYLERATGKIPFEYHIKEAMKKLLKREEREN